MHRTDRASLDRHPLNAYRPCAVLGVALLSAGCALLKPPAHRLDALESASSCARPAKALVILLPGRFDTPQDLIDN